MKAKTSVTLDPELVQGIDRRAGDFRSRSEFIEAAVEHYLRHLERSERERHDLETLNQKADALNKEAEDVLAYQVPV